MLALNILSEWIVQSQNLELPDILPTLWINNGMSLFSSIEAGLSLAEPVTTAAPYDSVLNLDIRFAGSTIGNQICDTSSHREDDVGCHNFLVH